jgi:lipopolysaccharide export system permease protein
MTNWQIASPLFRLAICVVAIHLALNLWGQPTAQRELRESLIEARTNLAASLIQPGEFTTTDALTLYARQRSGPDFIDIFITDARIPDQPVDYLAQSGKLLTIDGKPAFVLRDVQIHQIDEKGTLSILDLDQYKYDLAGLVREDSDTVYKSTDRYLPELIWLDPTNYVDAKSRTEFTAEVHYRLTSPLISIAVILFALWAVLGGDYSKLGYGKRIRNASLLVGLMFMLHIVAHSESENAAIVNVFQWLIPISAIIILSLRYFADISLNPVPVLRRWLERGQTEGQGFKT